MTKRIKNLEQELKDLQKKFAEAAAWDREQIAEQINDLEIEIKEFDIVDKLEETTTEKDYIEYLNDIEEGEDILVNNISRGWSQNGIVYCDKDGKPRKIFLDRVVKVTSKKIWTRHGSFYRASGKVVCNGVKKSGWIIPLQNKYFMSILDQCKYLNKKGEFEYLPE